MNVLFACSEAYPLIKTGGLGDVAGALPVALASLGLDIRLVLPAYPQVIDAVHDRHEIGSFVLSAGRACRIYRAAHGALHAPVWLIDIPGLFDRQGNPYVDETGRPWDDNGERFVEFARAVTFLAEGLADPAWKADVVHCNDWQTAVAAPLLSGHRRRPCTVFTIHNMSYDCLLDFAAFERLELPGDWWSIEGGEFYGRFSMLKSGIVYSDAVTTVSPRYAEEIRTPEFGYGYAGILEAHRDKLTGILNGIDDETWNPRRDPWLVRNYGVDDDVPAAKRVNLGELLDRLEATNGFRCAEGPVIGFVGRLVYQKGVDLLLGAIPEVLGRFPARFVLIGSGDGEHERKLVTLAREYPQHVVAFIGFSEPLAHLLEAGSDLFVMPSRFEPCGLNQMYSMLYGTPPIVRRTGGLADTVRDADPDSLSQGLATGFVFDEARVETLADAICRAIVAIEDPGVRHRLIRAGMSGDFGWRRSAAGYRELYARCVNAARRADDT